MNEQEIATLMRGAAPAFEALLARAIQPLVKRIEQIEQSAARNAAGVRSAVGGVIDGAVAFEVRSALNSLPQMIAEAACNAVGALPPAEPGKDADPAEITRMVSEAVAALPPPKDGEPGQGVDPETIRRMIADAVSTLPPAAPGKNVEIADVERMVAESVERSLSGWEKPRDGVSVTIDELAPMIEHAVSQAVAALPPAETGKDADPEVVADLVRTEVERAVGALPKPQDGRTVTPEELATLIDERLTAVVSEAVARIPAPKDGAAGKLGMVRAWGDQVFYESDVVTFDGAIYQAQRDTGRTPPHEDWLCIVSRGEPGKDAGEIGITGTFDVTRTYRRLEIVALNGGSFIAKRDDPGPCPGDGWQLIASQGNRGKPGDATKGDPGRPGPAVRNVDIDDQGMLTLVNADGTKVECDLYPLLSQIATTQP